MILVLLVYAINDNGHLCIFGKIGIPYLILIQVLSTSLFITDNDTITNRIAKFLFV